MSTLTVTPTYADGSILYESELDAVKSSIETYYNTTLIEGSNLQANTITGSTKLEGSAVTAAKLASSSVTSAKIADSTGASDGVTAAKLATDSVTTAKIADSAVTTAKIADSAVTTAKITDASLPKAVIPLPYYSTTAITNQTGAGTYVSVSATGLTVGRPVIILLESSTTSAGSGFVKMSGAFTLKRDSTTLTSFVSGYARYDGATSNYMKLPPSTYMHIDTPTGTSHTYSIEILGTTSQFNEVQIKIMQVI